MRDLVRRIRDHLLSTQDTVCLQRARLVTEGYRAHAGEPAPLKRARAFAHVLANMDLDVTSNPIFAGNTSSRPRAWMLLPEYGFGVDAQVALENDGLNSILDGQVADDLRDFWAERSFGGHCGVGHLAVDLDRVVHEGLEALVAEAESCGLDASPGDTYRKAMVVALRAVIDWAARYAEAAEAAAEQETDPKVRAAHLRVAKACRQVPARPARDLFEGLQAIALVHLATAIEGHGMSISVGLPDRVLAPFVGPGFDVAEATDLVAAFMLKLAANSLFGRGSKTQAITVGGADASGADRSSALTLCFLDAADLVRVGDPPLFLRWHEGLSPEVKRRAAEMLADGLSLPLLVSDEPTVAGLVGQGIASEDAWGYCVIGCNELGVPGLSMRSAAAGSGTLQPLALLRDALLDHPDPDAIAGTDGLLAVIADRMKDAATRMRRQGEAHWRAMAERVPTPFTSALMQGCIERGQDLLLGMKYCVPGLYERGVVNTVNALAAIQDLVFDRRAVSLTQIVQAMRDDFADEALRRALVAAPKWGNDEDRADRFAPALLQMRERVLDEVDRDCGDASHSVCHVVRSLHHLDGAGISASPDGRRAGEPLADSVGAQAGTARGGPTSTLRSVLKLDAPRFFRGGYNLNLTLPGGARPDTVLGLVEGFFREGGQELQINCLDAATLRDAQRQPERHGDLVVRVAGLSARFVDLSAVEQRELIARAEAVAGGCGDRRPPAPQ